MDIMIYFTIFLDVYNHTLLLFLFLIGKLIIITTKRCESLLENLSIF